MAKSTNSRERANAALTIWTDSVYFGSARSACRLSLVTFAGLDARPSRNRSSRLRVTSREISGAARRFLIFRNTFGSASLLRIATQRAGRSREARFCVAHCLSGARQERILHFRRDGLQRWTPRSESAWARSLERRRSDRGPRGAKGIDVDPARHGAGRWLRVAVQDRGRHDRCEEVPLGESPG